jgi:uncharacterized YigZ family protein
MRSVDSYRTPRAPCTHEIPKIKGSRFIADVAVAADVAAALAHVAAIRKKHHAARHVCWAYRIGEGGERTRASDDGEPSGSGGRPILRAIEQLDLTFVVVAVTRYYGGTKLGVGNLGRAYGGAAAEGLARLEIDTIVPTLTVEASVGYDQLGLLETFCVRESVKLPEGAWGERVVFLFEIPVAAADDFADRLVDRSSGRIEATVRRDG